MKRYTQAEKAKVLVQEVLQFQKHGTVPKLITEILSRKGVDISTFEALSRISVRGELRRVDMYSLLYPYSNTTHGKILYVYMVGLRGKKNVKASVRNLFSQLVCREHIMGASPVLFYEHNRFYME